MSILTKEDFKKIEIGDRFILNSCGDTTLKNLKGEQLEVTDINRTKNLFFVEGKDSYDYMFWSRERAAYDVTFLTGALAEKPTKHKYKVGDKLKHIGTLEGESNWFGYTVGNIYEILRFDDKGNPVVVRDDNETHSIWRQIFADGSFELVTEEPTESWIPKVGETWKSVKENKGNNIAKGEPLEVEFIYNDEGLPLVSFTNGKSCFLSRFKGGEFKRVEPVEGLASKAIGDISPELKDHWEELHERLTPRKTIKNEWTTITEYKSGNYAYKLTKREINHD